LLNFDKNSKIYLGRKEDMHPIILAIESSCDDTSAAIMANGILLSNVVSSQLDHAVYGGVIPELASRKHEELIILVIEQALKESGISLSKIDAIAVTAGPGLLGSLLVGITTAKSMAMSLSIPLIEVNHMQAHILAHFIDDPKPQFPFLCLTVSGGHTQLVKVNSAFDMDIIGQTLDDAAGEAFDKIGKMLGLTYPSGPIIDSIAQKGKPLFSFPISRLKHYQFSFSGLKTSFLYFLQKEMKSDIQFIKNNLNDLAASAQYSIVENLILPFVEASKDLNIKQLAICGGVSANSLLRKRLKEEINKIGGTAFIPDLKYCTDNAAMIAMAGHFSYLKGDFAHLSITAKARWNY
jgi:N6-L-threonylcarbamoyladenine synthase